MQSEIPTDSEQVVSAPITAERPVADIAAEHRAQTASVEAEHGEAMSKEARCAEIGEFLLTIATTDPDGEKYLAEYLEHTAFPEGTNDCLFKYEQKKRSGDPEYDITQQSPRRLAKVLQRNLEEDAETQETVTEAEIAAGLEDKADDKVDDAEEALEIDEAYTALINSPEYKNASNVEKIALMANHEDAPESERAKWQAFGRILAIAEAAPQDAQIVRTRVNQLDLSQGVPDPVGFARAFIFDNSQSQISSGVSDATQEAIAAELGIVRDQFNVKTGDDIRDIYKNGVGSETYRDENGDIQTRRVPLAPGDDVEIRDGQFLGMDDRGNPVMKIVGEHAYTSNLPENPTAEDMTMYAITTQWVGKLNDSNMAEMFFPHSVMERGGGHIELNMPDDFNRAQQLSQIFFGAMAGYNGELLSQPDLDRIPYLLQFQNEKGDAVIGDVNPDQILADYRQQGVLNKDDTLNWDRFTVMIETNRNGLFFSEERYGENAQNRAA